MSVLNFGFHAIDFGFFVSGTRIPNFNRQRDCRIPGLNVGLQSLEFGIPQAKNSRPGDLDYFTCSEKFKITMACCRKISCGGIPFYPPLDTEAKTKANQQNWYVTAYRVLFTCVTFGLITRDLDQLEDLEKYPRYIGILTGATNDCFL